MTTTLSEIGTQVVVMGVEDWVGIWEVAMLVRHADPAMTEDQVMRASVDVVRELLDAGLVSVGGAKDGFQPWDVTESETLARITSRWQALDHPMRVGDTGTWLCNTAEGDRLGRAFAPAFADDDDE